MRTSDSARVVAILLGFVRGYSIPASIQFSIRDRFLKQSVGAGLAYKE
jgi:hypothetical protein